ncbi:MAG: hypothetical protein AABY53_01890, partial [Bdellovibrionota bacterium]
MRLALFTFFIFVALIPFNGFAADVLSTAPLGWTQLANTKIRPVCPVGSFGDCGGVTQAWNSAVFDSKRNRLIVWGGGHQDYFGNEIYALNLSATPITMTRINNPSTAAISGGQTADNPPQPGSR